MRNRPESRLYDELVYVGNNGTVKEFTDALKRFGSDERAVDALAEGLAAARKSDSFSDYATSETAKISKKAAVLRDFDLRQGMFKRLPTSAERDGKSLEAIFTAIARIEERMDKIEGCRQPAQKRSSFRAD